MERLRKCWKSCEKVGKVEEKKKKAIANQTKAYSKPKVVPPPKTRVIEKKIDPNAPLVRSKTIKVIQEDRRKITIVTLIIDNEMYVYKKEEFSWGAIFYYKNNKRIAENTYEADTSIEL